MRADAPNWSATWPRAAPTACDVSSKRRRGFNATQVGHGLAGFAPLSPPSPGPSQCGPEARTLTDDQTLVVLDGARQGARRLSGAGPAPQVFGRWDPAVAVAALDGRQRAGAGPSHRAGRAPSGSLTGSPWLRSRAAPSAMALGDAIDIETLLRRVTPSGSKIQYSLFYNGRRLATTFGSGAPATPPEAQAAASQGDTFGLTNIGGRTYASYYTALAQGSGPQVLLAAEVDDSVFAAQNTNDILVVLFTTTLLGTVLSVIAVVFARRFAFWPLRRLGQGAARLGGETRATRVEVGAPTTSAVWPAASTRWQRRSSRAPEQLEEQRARLGAALTSLSAVSRAPRQPPRARARCAAPCSTPWLRSREPPWRPCSAATRAASPARSRGSRRRRRAAWSPSPRWPRRSSRAAAPHGRTRAAARPSVSRRWWCPCSTRAAARVR